MSSLFLDLDHLGDTDTEMMLNVVVIIRFGLGHGHLRGDVKCRQYFQIWTTGEDTVISELINKGYRVIFRQDRHNSTLPNTSLFSNSSYISR